MRAGPDGLSAGDIAAAVATPPSTLSHHLGHLERAGLATSRRDGRQVVYAAHYPGIRDLLGFLMDDCCQGRAELCLPTIACEGELV